MVITPHRLTHENMFNRGFGCFVNSVSLRPETLTDLHPHMTETALSDLCRFIHDVQKERGAAALFLRSQGSDFSEFLETRFFATDRAATNLGALPRKQSSNIDPLLNAVHYLGARRKYIVSRLIDPAEAHVFYTREIIAPALDIVQELAVFDPANDPARVSAFVSFMQWKEHVGRQRALGGYLLQNAEALSEARALLEYIIAKQQAYERMFLSLCDEATRQFVTSIYDTDATFREVRALNNTISTSGGLKAMEAFSARQWFDLFTCKMDRLYEIGGVLLDKLALPVTGADRPPEPPQPALHSTSAVGAHFERVSVLPLFAGIAPQVLKDIMKFSRVHHYEKGAMIFMQGEQAMRFYILLNGWVKLYKSNAEGQESILQMVKSGDTMLETTIFGATQLPVNAQAVEHTDLLSIPASIMREKLQSDQTLAMNMMAVLADRSQAMISQFEQLTLKSVSQRVGRFLLNLMLDSGERSTRFDLPYDKSLIAGYLGMKPETFSRALQALKDRGIDVDRSHISLPDVFALCEFCDMETASRCERHATADCPNPDP